MRHSSVKVSVLVGGLVFSTACKKLTGGGSQTAAASQSYGKGDLDVTNYLDGYTITYILSGSDFKDGQAGNGDNIQLRAPLGFNQTAAVTRPANGKMAVALEAIPGQEVNPEIEQFLRANKYIVRADLSIYGANYNTIMKVQLKKRDTTVDAVQGEYNNPNMRVVIQPQAGGGGGGNGGDGEEANRRLDPSEGEEQGSW